MARHMNMAAIMGALRSPKTPAGLKKGLLKKYGHMLGKEKMPMSALATTVKVNPKKENKMAYGTSFHEQAKRIKAKKIDIYVTEGPYDVWNIDYSAKKYIGKIKGISKAKAFLKAAKGLEISWQKL